MSDCIIYGRASLKNWPDPFHTCLGSEIELTAARRPQKFPRFPVGYNWFLPGDHVRAAGPADTAGFFHARAELNY
jgi:hypothetical protein